MIIATHHTTVGWVITRISGSADCYCVYYEHVDVYGGLWLHGSAIAPSPPRFYYSYNYPARMWIYWWYQADWVSDRIATATGGLPLRGAAGIGPFTHIILGNSGIFGIFPWFRFRLTFPSSWSYIGTTNIVMLPNMRVDWITHYEITSYGIGEIAGNIEIISVSAWETYANGGMTVEWHSWSFVSLLCVPDVHLTVKDASLCSVAQSWFPVDGLSFAGIALLQLHLVFVVLPLIIVGGTAGNPVDYDIILVYGSDSARGYSVVVGPGQIASTYVTLHAGTLTVRAGGTRTLSENLL